MLPTITFFGKTIAMYGLMILLGIGIGIILAVKRSDRYQISRQDVLFSSCYGVIGLVIGAKLLFIVTIVPSLLRNQALWLSDISMISPLLSGGFVFYGGLLGALLGYYIYCRQYHIRFICLLDLIAPSVPIIHGFGRIGCFFAGCCYGLPYRGPLHIIFHKSTIAPNNLALLPIQLIESGFNFLAGFGLLYYAGRKPGQGKLIGVYLIYYAIFRFLIEFFRGDGARGIIYSLSISQWISLLLLPFGIWLYRCYRYYIS